MAAAEDVAGPLLASPPRGCSIDVREDIVQTYVFSNSELERILSNFYHNSVSLTFFKLFQNLLFPVFLTSLKRPREKKKWMER